jgi:hypothetical protein
MSLAGVPIEVAIKTVVVVAIQIVSGAFLYSLIPRSESPTIPEYLGMGFAIGAALSILCDVFLKATPIDSVAWLLPTLVVVVIRSRCKARIGQYIGPNFHISKSGLTELFAVLVISFLYLAHDFIWYISLFVVGVCVLIAVDLGKNFKTSTVYVRAIIALTAISTASLFAGLRFRSPFWWMNSDDYQLFQSMQISLARYGPRDHLGATGISVTSYHFLPYSWTGLLEKLSSAPTWVTLTRVSPIIVSIILSALVWTFFAHNTSLTAKTRFVLACLYPLLFVFSFGSPSSAVGYIFLLAAVFYWTNRNTAFWHWSRIPLGVLFTIFVIGTKISNSPVIFLGLGVLAVIGFITNQPWKWVSLIDLLIAATTGAFYYILFLRYTKASTSMGVELFGFARQIFGDINELHGRSLLIIGSIASSAFIVIPILGITLYLLQSRPRFSQLGYFALPIFPLLVTYLLVIGGHGGSAGYFVNSALSILLLIALLAVAKNRQSSEHKSSDIVRFTFFGSTGFVAGLVTSVVLEHSRAGGRTAMLGRAVASAPWIFVVLIGILWFIYDFTKPRKSRRSMTLLSLVLVGVISADATVHTIDMYRIARQPQLSMINVESVIGTPDEIAAGNWLNSNTPINSIIASNHFCGPKECFGPNWFDEQIDFFAQNKDLLKNEWRGLYWIENCPQCNSNWFGGTNFVLPAYSKRRFLIQGPRFLWGLSDPPAWAIARMSATLGFANSPSEQTVMALRKFKVEYFVVDLESTTQRTWLPFGSLLYQNRSFAILQLADVL